MPHVWLNIKRFMRKRPRIGMTMRLDLENRRFYLGRNYCEALEHYGALPVHLGLIAKRDYIAAILDELDGILLPGSDTDVDPHYYSEEPHPKLKTVIPEKDETDFLVLEEAAKRNLPILAICYGMQSLNVFRGGSLIQDIEAQAANSLKHEQGRPLARNSHHIVIESGTLLNRITRDDNVQKADGENAKNVFVKVNSHHHQAVRICGENLRISSRAVDGIVESIEDTDEDKFVLGVQWHPELSYETDDLSSKIFKNFVQFCSARGDKK